MGPQTQGGLAQGFVILQPKAHGVGDAVDGVKRSTDVDGIAQLGGRAASPQSGFRVGDTIQVRCTYDNSLDNELVSSALQQRGLTAPVDVKLGESTLDEMCLGVLPLLYKAP